MGTASTSEERETAVPPAVCEHHEPAANRSILDKQSPLMLLVMLSVPSDVTVKVTDPTSSVIIIIIIINRISIAPYGRNFRGAGSRSDQCSVKACLNKTVLSLGPDLQNILR